MNNSNSLAKTLSIKNAKPSFLRRLSRVSEQFIVCKFGCDVKFKPDFVFLILSIFDDEAYHQKSECIDVYIRRS